MSGAGAFLKQQVGPLPMGVWIGVGGGGLAIAYWQRKNASAEPKLLTDVREVAVPVGAIAVPDGAPLVITPIFRLPDIVNNIINPSGPAPVVNVTVPTQPRPAPAPPRTVPRSPRPQPVAARRTHTVRSGDTLWAIAVRHYGNPLKWRTIYAANAAKIDGIARSRGKAGGGWWIFPGTILVIP